MSVTAQSIVNGALQWLGELEDGETPNASESANALIFLNRIIDNWNIQDNMATAATQLTATLAANTASVTLGTRLAKVVGAVVKGPGIGPTFPLKIVNAQEWSEISDRDALSNMQEVLFYDRGTPTGTCYVSPVPQNNGFFLIVTGWLAQPLFADLTTPNTLLPGYERALVTNLAMDLAPNYEVESSKELLAALTTSMQEIQRLNMSLWGNAAPAAS
jgi:hypothetical protein